MTVFQFVILSLAVYRLTVLVSRDSCPFRICARLRAIDRLKVLRCPFCSSVWISAIANLTFYYTCAKSPLVILVALIFAMSAISIILDRAFTADHLVN